MTLTGNEQWDESNARYDLLHGNRAGALWAEERLRSNEINDPKESVQLVRRAGWKRFRVGSARYIGKAYPDPKNGVHRVIIRKVDPKPVTGKGLMKETIEALPFGFDAVVMHDYVKYGINMLKLRKDAGKPVFFGAVKALTHGGAMKKAMDRFIRRKSR